MSWVWVPPEASARTFTARPGARARDGPRGAIAVRARSGLRVFFRTKGAPRLRPQPLRCGLKGAVISCAVRSVGACSIAPSTAKALDLTPASWGSPGGTVGAKVQTPPIPRARRGGSRYCACGATWALLLPLADPFMSLGKEQTVDCILFPTSPASRRNQLALRCK
jgi:hypothetical protein